MLPEELELVEDWIRRRIGPLLKDPYAIRNGVLYVSREDFETVKVVLHDYLWYNRKGFPVIACGIPEYWNILVYVYHSKEEFVWIVTLS
jgi:hypothetical protein